MRQCFAQPCTQNKLRDPRCAVVLFVLFQALATAVCAADHRQFEKIDEQQLSDGGWHGGQRVNQVYFDADGRLRWDDSPLQAGTSEDCGRPPPVVKGLHFVPIPHQVLLARPRVDLRSCPDVHDSERTVLGIDASGRITWQRKLGGHRYPLPDPKLTCTGIIGGAEDALVTNTLEVWSPQTGETLVPAVTRGRHSGGWDIPRYRFAYGAWWRAQQHDFIVLTQDGDDHDLGPPGVHRLTPTSGQHELLIPETRCGMLNLFARVHVEGLRTDVSGRYLFIRRVCEGRGYTPWSEVIVFDTRSKETIYEERFEKMDNIVSIAVAGNGDFGVAVHDNRQALIRLLRYRLRGN